MSATTLGVEAEVRVRVDLTVPRVLTDHAGNPAGHVDDEDRPWMVAAIAATVKWSSGSWTQVSDVAVTCTEDDAEFDHLDGHDIPETDEERAMLLVAAREALTAYVAGA